VPELNTGQLAMLIRANYPATVVPLNKIQGRPFTVEEVLREIRALTAVGTAEGTAVGTAEGATP
jgi:2-oxoglutarate ferredoxin oxidoreductase subunit alpha